MRQKFVAMSTAVAVVLLGFSFLLREARPKSLDNRMSQSSGEFTTRISPQAATSMVGAQRGLARSPDSSEGPSPSATSVAFSIRPTTGPIGFKSQLGQSNSDAGLLRWLPSWLPHRPSTQAGGEGAWPDFLLQPERTWKPVTEGKLYYLSEVQLSTRGVSMNTTAHGYMLICAPDYDSKSSVLTITATSPSGKRGEMEVEQGMDRFRRWVEEEVGPDAFKVVVYNDQMRAAGSVYHLSRSSDDADAPREAKEMELRKLYRLCRSASSEADASDSRKGRFRSYPYLVRFPVWLSPGEGSEAGEREGTSTVMLKVDVKWELDHYRSLQEKESTVSVFKNKYIARGATISLNRPKGRQEGQLRMECSRELVQRGSGVFVKTAKEKDPQLQYYPWSGSEWQYTMQECAVVQYGRRPKRLFQCLRQRIRTLRRASGTTAGGLFNILFTGDSQVRTLYRHWVAVLSNTRAVQAKGGNLTFTLRIPHVVSGDADDGAHYSTTSDYLWDPYLEGLVNGTTFPSSSISYDAVVIGLGAWPSSFGQWSMTQFDAHIQKAARKLSDLSRDRVTPVELIWAGSPAWPKPRQMPGFRITNYRLATMNAVGAHRLAIELRGGKAQGGGGAAGISLLELDWFWVSFPWAHLHRGDGMHYDHSLVLYTAASLLGNLLCATT